MNDHERGEGRVDYLDQLFRFLQIDEEWAVRRDDRFTWWPFHHAQHVELGEIEDDEEGPVHRLTIWTDFLIGGDWQQLDPLIAALNTTASTHALVRQGDRIALVSSCFIYDAIADWMIPLAALAAALQISFQSMDPHSLLLPGTRPDESSHPTSGKRQSPDEMVFAAGSLPDADDPSRWLGSSEFEGVAEMLTAGGILATAGHSGLSVEVGIGPNGGPASVGGVSALIQAVADQRNPNLGGGLLMLLLLPDVEEVRRGPTPPQLSVLDLAAPDSGNFFGGWCQQPGESHNAPAFVTFIPNAAYRPGVLFNLVLSLCVKARWAEGLIYPGR